MALPGYYRVNFTDPRKPGFIIEPYQTDGTINPTSPVIDAKARRASTSLLLYGRDVPNYGERTAENFVQLLENFAGPGAPQNPIEGQLWFDTGTIYTVTAWSSPTTLLFADDFTEAFNQFIEDATVLTLAFNPVNASVDNSMQQVQLVVDSCELLPNGMTSAVFKTTDGTYVHLPNTVVNGFLALSSPTYSRLRVATTLGGEVQWLDVNNVLSSIDEPEATTIRVGDLWYNTDTAQLMICGLDGHWKSVAAKYIPISGTGVDPITGDDIVPMEGDINMGPYKVFSQGTITTLDADRYMLITREYADNINENLQDQVDVIVSDIAAIRDGEIKSKVSKSGDEMTGVLIFGDGQSTSTLTGPNARGIDANGYPVVNVLNDWSANDYMDARFDSTQVVDKTYVAKSFTQFQLDFSSGGDGFIHKQDDGTGVFSNSVSFNLDTAGTTNKLSWFDITRTKEHSLYGVYSGVDSQFVIQAGSGSTIDFRNASRPLNSDPLFRLEDGSAESYQPMYILDGQPQPIYNGDLTSKNDDTSAATKGFVRKYLTDTLPEGAGEPDAFVNDAQFVYNLDTFTYTLTILQTNNKPPVSVNFYHKHKGSTLPHTYAVVSGLDWSPEDPIQTLVAADNPTFPDMTVDTMLRAMNVYKAPVVNAIFTNVPRVGTIGRISAITGSTLTVIGDVTATTVQGCVISVINADTNNGLYFVASSAVGATDPTTGKPTTIVTVKRPFAVNATYNPITSGGPSAEIGAFVPTSSVRGLVTRATLSSEIEKVSLPDYYKFAVTADATNTIRSLTFGYRVGTNKLWIFRNGQKLRNGIVDGGDYDELTATTIKIASEHVGDVFEIYQI